MTHARMCVFLCVQVVAMSHSLRMRLASIALLALFDQFCYCLQHKKKMVISEYHQHAIITLSASDGNYHAKWVIHS